MHWQMNYHFIAILPCTINLKIFGSLSHTIDFTIDRHLRILSPLGDAKVKRKIYSLSFGYHFKADAFLKRIVGYLLYLNFLLSSYFDINCRSRIQHRCDAIIIRRHIKMFGIIGPSLTVIMLATPRTERIHHQERATIFYTWSVIAAVADSHIRTSDIP